MNIHLVEKPPSSVEKLLATIRAKSGSLPSLAQNSQWRERVQLVLDYLRTAKDVTPFGRLAIYRYLLLEINAVQCFETVSLKFPQVVVTSHPDQRNRPIFIFGLPRSGTTLLYHLLALYPEAFSPTRLLAVFAEMSPSDIRKASSLADLRQKMKIASKQYTFAHEAFTKSIFSIPYSVHPTALDGPEECLIVLNNYLFYETLPIVRARDFTDFVSEYKDLSDKAYRLYKRDLHVMQSITSANGRRSRFVLKAPHHTPFPDVIRRHFPNAYFVRMHRNPAEVVASLSSLLRVNNAPFQSRVDLVELGRSVQTTICNMAKELVRQTSQMPKCTIDLRFEEFSRDPISVCTKIAIEVGMEHTKAVEEKLTAFLIDDKAKRTRAGKHEYTLEEFGLDAEEIRSDCKEYCEMFSV